MVLLEVFRQWNFVADFWWFLSKFMRKTSNLGIWTPCWEVGVTHDHGRLSIRVNGTFFAIYYGSGVTRRNVYSSAVLAGGRPLCTHILPGGGGRGHLHQSFLATKTTDTGLPDGEDRIPLRFLVLTQYQSVTDRQTDGRTEERFCRSIYSACRACFAERCKSIITFTINKFTSNLYTITVQNC